MNILPVFLAIMLLAVPVMAHSEPAVPAAPAAATSGLALPRFVSTRSETVNVRSGPGERYPVLWVLRRRGMPVEITAEYENWRKIRDWAGTEGWVHQALLSGRRSAVVYPREAVLRERPDPIARPLARIQPGVIASLDGCEEDWCELAVGQAQGWINKTSLWGVYPGEIIE